MPTRLLAAMLAMLAVLCCGALALPAAAAPAEQEKPATTSPLARAHAHNDYEHERPLLDALDTGFTSVEADVWLVDGELLVSHDLAGVQAGRTLASLYLDPLQQRVSRNGGSVYRGWAHSVHLLIDIKSEAAATYTAVDQELRRFRKIFTSFTSAGVRERAVTAVISGNRPLALMRSQDLRYAGYDGRSADLGGPDGAGFIPLVSDNWTTVFTYQGIGPMLPTERTKLEDFVSTAHAKGQRVRFWSTPETAGQREAVWSELVAAGVDYINTDDLQGLRAWLLANDPHPTKPEVDWFN